MTRYIRKNPSTGLNESPETIQSSSGAPDADKIISTDPSGKIDATFLPAEALEGATYLDVVLGEDVNANDLVQVYNDGGTLKARKATAASTPRRACGRSTESGTTGETKRVIIGDHDFTSAAHGFTLGDDSPIFLSTTAGGMTHTVPSTGGQLIQCVGFAIDANTIRFSAADRGLLLL